MEVVRCISDLKKGGKTYLVDGRTGDFMPKGYLPFDYNPPRIMGHDMDYLRLLQSTDPFLSLYWSFLVLAAALSFSTSG